MPDHPQDPSQSLRTEVSDAVVNITRQYTGRGPTRARAVVDRDAVLVLLYDTLTKGERVLVEHHEDAQVLELRDTYQRTMRADLIGAIERLTGRAVTTFMSTTSTEPDVSAEIFLLGGPITAPAPETPD